VGEGGAGDAAADDEDFQVHGVLSGTLQGCQVSIGDLETR
jgi:hypothetical protein